MFYYGIYYNNEYKVTKRQTHMANNREWFKKHYGFTANHYKAITRFEYYLLKLFGKSIDGLE